MSNDKDKKKKGKETPPEAPPPEAPPPEAPPPEAPPPEAPPPGYEPILLEEDFGVPLEAPIEWEIKKPEVKGRGPPVAEKTRQMIAFILVFGLLALFFSSFLFAGTVDEAIKLIQALSSALTGLIGAVLGYYFGAITTERKEESPEELYS